MLPVIRKCITPAPDSEWWKRGEGGGEFWRVPFIPLYRHAVLCHGSMRWGEKGAGQSRRILQY